MVMSVDDFDAVLRSFYERTELRVDSLPRREFMFSHSRRHHAFEDMDQLMEYVHDNPPVSITHSLARYFDPARREPFGTKEENPEEHTRWKMEDKGFSTVDIGFDIDYDHLPNISTYRQGLEQARLNAMRLHVFLTRDLGVPASAISIRFSGHRGFHMVVSDESLVNMSKEERTNIENYVRGDQVHLSGFMHVSNSKYVWSAKQGQYDYRLYPRGVPGWGGLFTATFVEMVDEYRSLPDEKSQMDRLRSWIPLKEDVKESVFKRPTFTSEERKSIKDPTLKQIHNFLMNDHALTQMTKDWAFSHWAKIAGMKVTAIKHLIEMVVQQTQLRKGVEADQITKDLKRQLRTPGSLHASSGMPCIEITYAMLEDLDAMFDFIRDTLGRDKVDIVVKNDIDSHVLDRLVVAGEYTVPRWEAYTILCADKRIEDDKKEMATPTSEEADAAVV